MKTIVHPLNTAARVSNGAALLFCACLAGPVQGANKSWDGGGADNNWLTGANWNADTIPLAGDALFFGGTTRLLNTNNFAGGTFTNLTFTTPAGGFTLNGAAISFGGNMTNNQVVTPETINLPLSLNNSPFINVVSNGILVLGGGIGGAGLGLTKVGGGQLTLGANNSFGGAVTINSGSVLVSSDANLGAIPGVATPGSVVLNGGTLRTLTSMTINTNRGVALRSGGGTFDVGPGVTLTNASIIASNGPGTGNLTKLGFGGLTLVQANTYNGATIDLVGTVTLDFTQPISPVTNIIASTSALTLGGANSGFGTTNFAQLTMVGKGATTNSQTFNGTHVTFGGSVIRATNGPAGKAYLNLGALDHDPGGTLTVVSPGLGGNGDVSTTTPNVNGILGGWATVGDAQNLLGIIIGTNFASVDASGNITNYRGYDVFTTGLVLHGNVTGQTNLLLNQTSTGDVVVDADGAGTLTDINAINVRRWESGAGVTGTTIVIGTNNTLRLGKYGSIFKSDTLAGVTWGIGSGPTATGGGNGSQDSGTLTAGGADGEDGEIVFNVNNTSSSSGTILVDCKVTDNIGGGAVTFVKTGPGSMKLRGHNTFSGGCYLLQGRVQFVGGEIGTGNATAGGSGDIYVLPGAYLFPSGGGPADPVTNRVFIAGNGTQGEPLGAMRLSGGWNFSGPMVLVGDTTLGGNGGAGGPISGPISGAFSLALCSPATVNGTVSISNPDNSWNGTTTLNARNNTGNNIFLSGNSEIIPNGFGKGNVVMNGFGTGTIAWNLNGFSETVNGLSTTGTGASCFIQNDNASGTNSILTVGDNDGSGNFAGTMRDNSGSGGFMSVAKIGGGIITLSGTNAYTGNTTVNGGTLALVGSGAIPTSSNIIVNAGATLDVSGLGAFFSASSSIRVNNGTLLANTIKSSAPTLALSNSAITLVADTASPNIVTTTLTTAGATNLINLITVAGVSGYPAQFVLIKYSGSIGGSGFNFGLGSLPNSSTVGYVSNDVANAQVVLVLLDGPKPLTWVGNLSRNWDLALTTNWLAFKGGFNEAPAAFNTADTVFFDDTSLTNIVNLTTAVVPGGVNFNNAANYTIGGAGAISGFGGVVKQGVGTVTFANTGSSDFKGGLTVSVGKAVLATDNSIGGGASIASGATLQIGTNGGTGTFPSAGNIANDGSLIVQRGANLTVGNTISGAGSLTKIDTNILTVTGVNTFTGAVAVLSGTLKAGSGGALGTADGGTLIASGAVLDVNAQNLGAEPITVAGSGLGNAGAIVNSGADQINALQAITLTNHTTFGGAGRWDIRGGSASLSTGGQPYNLTKVGVNQFSLVGVGIDGTPGASLANITVSNGTFSVETSTSSVGDPAATLTVVAGATLQLFALGVPLDKNLVLNGTGTNTTLNNGSGVCALAPSVGTTTLNGACIVNAGGTSLALGGSTVGPGSLTKIGANILSFPSGSVAAYAGSTTVSNGTLIVDGTKAAGAGLSVRAGSTLGGNGVIGDAVTVTNATISPGDPNGSGAATLTFTNSLVICSTTNISTTNVFELSPSSASGNDLIAVGNNLTLVGTNAVQIVPLQYLNVGDVYTLFTYGGSLIGSTSNLRLVGPNGFSFSFVSSPAPNTIQIRVDQAVALDTWVGNHPINPTTWDNFITTNWIKNGIPTPLAVFTNFDYVSFDDTAATNFVNLVGTLFVSGVGVTNASLDYTFAGPGRLSGNGYLGKDFQGLLLIANRGTNDMSGPITIGLSSQVGTIQVGNGSTNGNLGGGNITNRANLSFNRSDDLRVTNRIFNFGPGDVDTASISNIGSGVLTLAGANGFSNIVVVASGTLRVDNSAALGATNRGTLVVSNATLDVGGPTAAVNALNLNGEQILVSGAGVGGRGAIVSTSTNAQQNVLRVVTLQGDTTFGGIGPWSPVGANPGRWDIRGTPANSVLDTGFLPMNLTKTGSNQVSLVGVAIDATPGGSLATIDLQQGALSFESTTTSMGDPNSNVVVHAGATLSFFNTTNLWNKVFLLSGDGNNTNIFNWSGNNTMIGPVTLSGGCVFAVAAGSLTNSNTISGSGSLIVRQGPLILAGPNLHSGITVITNSGRISLLGDVGLSNSPVINVASGVLDVSDRPDGTLTLGLGQNLQGNGTIWGSVVETAGSSVTPGASIGTLTVTNSVSLNGNTTMELDKPVGNLLNDQVRTTNITYGGTLIVSFLNTAGRPLVNGDSFRLFSAGSYAGAFGSTTLPPLGAGFLWNSTLSVNGTISVVSTVTNRPGVAAAVVGSNVVLSGTNGIPNGQYYVLATTNVALSQAAWTRIATNYFDASGKFTTSIAINPAIRARFFSVQVP